MKNNTILFVAAITVLTFTVGLISGYGATKDELITGTEENDNISAGSGNQKIIAGDGNDLVSGGPGDDRIKDGAGDDYVLGGEGNDTVVLGKGNDYINLGAGDDTIVIDLNEDIGKLNLIDGGEGFDQVVFVTDEVNDIVNNEIVQYYEKERVYGRKIVDMNGVNIAAGLTGIEQVGVAASYTF